MDEYYVISADGKAYGPIDLDGLLKWVKEGRVLKATPIRKGDAAPVPAGSLPEIAAAFSAPPPPMATPPLATSVALPGEFRVWDFIGAAWELVKPHWLPLGLMALIMGVMYCVPYLGACVSFVIGTTIMVGFNRAILGMIAGKPPEVGMLFSGFDRFGQAFLAGLVMGILVALGFVCLIVPGIILSIMWMFVSLILAETNLDFWPAMELSARLTAGYRWHLFGLMLAFILVGILGFLACCIGVLIAQPVILTATALAYRFLQARQAAKVS
jgi:uncharacterized membrane protein